MSADANEVPTLLAWFEGSARRTPQATAVELREDAYSYRQLDQYSRWLAERILVARGSRPERIGLLASRSLLSFVGYLAAFRLGATVVPLSPAHPELRNKALCSLARVDLVVADDTAVLHWERERDAARFSLLALSDAAVCARPALGGLPMAHPESATQQAAAEPDDVACILYASGANGRPKGVPIRHRHIARQVADFIERFEVGPDARVSHTFDLTSDASLYELFVTWGAGATLVVPQRSELLVPADHLVTGGISHIFAGPALISAGAALDKLPLGMVKGLRYSVFLGDRLTYRQAELWRAVAPGTVIENVYGPTEQMAACAAYRLPADRDQWPDTPDGTVPIGRFSDGVDHVILGEDGREAAEGELCVRAQRQLDGYLNPADDLRRFVRFGTLTYFRTGDRVRRSGGELVHLGRVDDQLRLRGQRVEPGEVESLLRRHALVTDAAVIGVRGRGAELELVACYTGAPFDHAAMKTWLRKRIPSFMVPRRFVLLDAIPVKADGKIDRAALLRGCTHA
ncbi:AMP-binding protein [Actinocrinis sp.]|uniref:AMP-binding protein n=1 Tax=Actinocrinis sp. TaxID=1920516 RepID=UPI002D4FE8F7|nr:AMP-binding protein [Actinocrinis sp.]HZP54497.1 AMP-binding protein [Actinocrinis sp.]